MTLFVVIPLLLPLCHFVFHPPSTCPLSPCLSYSPFCFPFVALSFFPLLPALCHSVCLSPPSAFPLSLCLSSPFYLPFVTLFVFSPLLLSLRLCLFPPSARPFSLCSSSFVCVPFFPSETLSSSLCYPLPSKPISTPPLLLSNAHLSTSLLLSFTPRCISCSSSKASETHASS